jgi:exodeoxyribonuclease V alpha subunit
MRVTVTSILSAKDYGTIFACQIDDPNHSRCGELVRVKALSKVTLGQPVAGELWEVEGAINDSRYGPQINAEKAIRLMPTGKLIVSFLAAHAPGVGLARAEALWLAFGVDLRTVLSDETNIPRISQVIAPDRPNLAPRLAAACVQTWKEAEAETKTLHWLTMQGVEDVETTRSIVRILGDKAVERLSANPYCLVPLLPWKKVDAIGRKLMVEQNCKTPSADIRRLVGACDAVVKAEIADGHTAGDFDTLRAGLARHLKVAPDASLVDQAIAAGKRHGSIVPGSDGWRAPGCASMEVQVLGGLREIAASTGPVTVPNRKVLERLMKGIQVGGSPLHPEQREAVLKVLSNPLACLQGGAGVGKTTTTQAICDLWERCGGSLLLTAIAGKAALRLSRSTGRLALTVARLRKQLEQREKIECELSSDSAPTDAEQKKLIKKLESLVRIGDDTLLVVDEASMLDLANANAILRFTPRRARLLLVGDEGQLPPVGFGLIFHRLVSDDAITARLTVIHRQTEASGIPVVAAAIRSCTMPVLPEYSGLGTGVSFVPCGKDELQERVKQLWSELGDVLPPLIVTATNDHPAGIHALNTLLHDAHRNANETEEIKGFLGQWFSVGDPVVYLRNDYNKGLFNGLLGTVVDIDPENRCLHAMFDGYEQAHEIETNDLIDLQLAYAITCHKAQGSQAPVVIVPLYPNRVLDPSWLYTAVTRAEHQVVLVGSREVLESALKEIRAADRRNVGFVWN